MYLKQSIMAFLDFNLLLMFSILYRYNLYLQIFISVPERWTESLLGTGDDDLIAYCIAYCIN